MIFDGGTFDAQNQTTPPYSTIFHQDVHSIAQLYHAFPIHGMLWKVLSAMLRESSTEVAELRCQEWNGGVSFQWVAHENDQDEHYQYSFN